MHILFNQAHIKPIFFWASCIWWEGKNCQQEDFFMIISDYKVFLAHPVKKYTTKAKVLTAKYYSDFQRVGVIYQQGLLPVGKYQKLDQNW